MNARFLAIAQDPSIIHGVHHYCDEWCHYCPVTRRCMGFRCTEEFRRQRGRRKAESTFTSMEEAIAFTRELAVLDGSRTEELDAILANAPGQSELTTADPLASVAWEYAVNAAFLLLPQTRELISRTPQASGPSAEEVVLWHHLRIYMKLVRALVSRSAAEQAEETAGTAGLECERGRQLHQQRSERSAKAGDLAEEPGQRLARTSQRALVRDQLGDLDGEAERGRYGGLSDRQEARRTAGPSCASSGTRRGRARTLAPSVMARKKARRDFSRRAGRK